MYQNCIKLYQIDLTDFSHGNFSSDDDEPVSPVFGKEKNLQTMKSKMNQVNKYFMSQFKLNNRFMIINS